MDHSDPLRTLFSDDIVFYQPGRNPTSGNYQGLDAVLGLLRTLGERSGGTFRTCRTASSPRPGPTRLNSTLWASSGPSHAD